jgi:poly(3-hydroxybutyrate) depolymerase
VRFLILFALGVSVWASDTKVSFTLNTTDAYGAPLQESRSYFVTRPDGLPKTRTAPMILVFEASANSGPDGLFRSIAAQYGFLIVSCSFSGNHSGTPGTGWNADASSFAGNEDYDYVSEVIKRVRQDENATDAFVAGLSKGGHMALAYACERPSMIRAAASIDEFMQPENRPTAQVPVIVFQGTQDTNVPYTMTRDTFDIWRAFNGLFRLAPVVTYEASPLQPGRVTQATWYGGRTGMIQAAFVSIVGGTHTYATPTIQTGYDQASAAWAFFSQFLTPTQDAPRIVSQPANNVQPAGASASFHVTVNAGAAVRYQWQRNGVDIPAANMSWYTTPPLTQQDDGATFRVVVANDVGTAASTAAKLTVTAAAAPAIANPPGVATAGQTVTFSAPLAATYQWTKNGMPIAGATGATLTIPALTSDSGAVFTVSGSPPVVLSVVPAFDAPIILERPVRVRTVPNQPATFSVKAWSATPMTYQWQKGVFTGNMADIPGATSSTYTFAQPALTDHLTLVRCVVSNSARSSVSASEMLFVTAAPNAPNQIVSPIHAIAQTGHSFVYDIVVTGGTEPLTYSASTLPAGLSIDPISGRISGAPGKAANITIGASNSVGAVSELLIVTVTDTSPVVSLDEWRLANFGASVSLDDVAGDHADPDHDGCTNAQEYAAGSNPLDAASLPTGLLGPRRGRSGCPHRPVR